MTRLCLTEDHARALIQHARSATPQEACGLLAGKGEQVHEVIAVPNAAADRVHYYRLDDAAFARALLRLDAEGLELLGFYHSHPDGDPIPSPTDIRQASYPDASYLIVGLRTGEARLAAWRMGNGAVTPVGIHVGLPGTAPEVRQESLSRAQVAAVLVSAMLVFALMILLSLSLLPPAPVIVTPIP